MPKPLLPKKLGNTLDYREAYLRLCVNGAHNRREVKTCRPRMPSAPKESFDTALNVSIMTVEEEELAAITREIESITLEPFALANFEKRSELFNQKIVELLDFEILQPDTSNI